MSEIGPERVASARLLAREAFATAHPEADRAFDRTIIDRPDFTVEAFAMEHRTPSMAYVVREKPSRNVDVEKLRELALPPGAWLQAVKDETSSQRVVEVNGEQRSVEELRDLLLTEKPGDSVAYLTDFLLNDVATETLAAGLKGCRAVICESQYRGEDLE
ncbi:MAG: hypothetical protein N2C14_22140, partial [Planctomycetales bacterium]